MRRQLLIATIIGAMRTSTAFAASTQWSEGYWSGANSVPQSSIQWNALTHIVHVNTAAMGDGSLQFQCSNNPICTESAMAAEAATLISAAHSHGVKVLDYVGTGTGTSAGTTWTGATNAANLSTFVKNIMHVVNTYGYDGVVIDWEGPPYNFTQMGNLFSALRTQLGTKPIVTTIVLTFSTASSFAALQSNVDRFDVMSFDLGRSNPTWFNSPLFSDTPNPNNIGSIDFHEQILVGDGIPAGKINIAMAFYGELQTGATGPRQNLSVSVSQINYNRIVANYPSQSANPTRDATAKVPWFTPGGNSWVTFDDATSIKGKVGYAQSKALGGWFIWALDQDYFAAQTPQHPLMAAIAAAMGSGATPPSSCDINGDGATNASDVQSCVNQALGVTTCSSCNLTQASPAACNVVDVQRDVNAALGGSCVVGP